MKILNVFNFKRLWLAALIFLSISHAWAIPYYWVAPAGAQVWNDPQNWSLTSGGSGGAGVPGLSDDAIFDSNGVGDCLVDITGLEVESLTFETGFGGLIDLGSTTLSTQQIVNFQTPMENGIVRILGGKIQIQTSNLAIELNGITDDLNLLSNTIQNLTLEITGASLNSVTGNTFTSAIDLRRTGPGLLVFESNSYQDATLRNQNNTGSIIARGNESYNTLNVYNEATSSIDLAYEGGTTTFSNQVLLVNTQNGTISIGLGGGTATLQNSASLQIGAFGTGTVSLNNLTVNGIYNPSVTTLTGTTHLHLANCTFNSPFNQILPRITCGTGNQFNEAFFIDVTGDLPSSISGAFNYSFALRNIVRSGTGTLTLESNNFQSYLALTNNNNSGSIVGKGNEVYSRVDVFNYADSPVDLAYEGGTTTFSNQVLLVNTQNGTISIGLGGGTATLQNSASLQIGAFGTGTVSLNNLTVNGIYNPSVTTLTGTTHLHLANCTFNSPFNQILPRITCGTGNQFNEAFFIDVTGDLPSSISGVFNNSFGLRNIVRSGTGTLTLESNNFQSYLAVTNNNNSGSIVGKGNEVYSRVDVFNYADSPVDLAYEGGTTTFSNQVLLVNTQNGTISIGLGGGTATLQNSASLQIGAFGTGTVSLNNLTVNGIYNPSVTTLTGTTHLHLTNCTFNSPFNQILPRITCGTGNQFNEAFFIDVTGDLPSSISGAFNYSFALRNIVRSGTGTLTLESNNFQSYLAVTNNNNSGSIVGKGNEVYSRVDVFNYADSPVDLAYEGGTTTFSNQVLLVNTQNGTISIGLGGGTATLQNSASLQIGAFGTGTVSLNNLTVNGIYNPSVTTLTGTTHLHLTNCTFNSPFYQILPRITCGTGNQFNNLFLVDVTGDQPSSISGNFNLLATIIRNGDGNLSIAGGNFIGNALIENESSAGSLQLSDNTFNQSVTFTQTNGTLQPCASGTSIFRGHIIFNTGTSGSDFVVGSSPSQGVMRLEGGTNQNISATGNSNIIIHRMELDKSAGAMNVNTPLAIATSITFTQGIMRTTDTNFIRFLDGALAFGASALSHIEGPARKLGNDAFTFPVGDGGTLRPISISAPSSITDEFTARFFRTLHPFGGVATYTAPLLTISACEYWTLDHTAGTSNVFVTLGWQAAECTGPYVTEPTTLEVARWNGTQWVSHGQGSFTGSSTAGTVTSAIAVSSFSPFALGSTELSNPLPITLLDFNAIVDTSQVVLHWRTASEINSSYFAVQRSATGDEFETIGQLTATQFSQSVVHYTYVDERPLAGKSYYRLKMIDLDDTTEFSKIIIVNFDEKLLQFYPNPTTDFLHLTQPRRIKLSTSMGITVLQSMERVTKLALPSDLAAGIYLLQTDQGEMFRIMIAR
jgi:hypothetical protein